MEHEQPIKSDAALWLLSWKEAGGIISLKKKKKKGYKEGERRIMSVFGV